jgi:hypothetical protein
MDKNFIITALLMILLNLWVYLLYLWITARKQQTKTPKMKNPPPPMKPNKEMFITEIREFMYLYVKHSEVLTEEHKKNFMLELKENNFIEMPFDCLVEEATRLALTEWKKEMELWKKENFELSILWKQIAIENAKINKEPYEVADKTLERFKERFSLQ